MFLSAIPAIPLKTLVIHVQLSNSNDSGPSECALARWNWRWSSWSPNTIRLAHTDTTNTHQPYDTLWYLTMHYVTTEVTTVPSLCPPHLSLHIRAHQCMLPMLMEFGFFFDVNAHNGHKFVWLCQCHCQSMSITGCAWSLNAKCFTAAATPAPSCMPLTLVSGRLSRHSLTLDRTVPPIPSESMEVSESQVLTRFA